jgi:hypothetical protein
VLKRPDAEHLIMGLNSGAFSLETIVHQLSNPALQVPLLQNDFSLIKTTPHRTFIENLAFVRYSKIGFVCAVHVGYFARR